MWLGTGISVKLMSFLIRVIRPPPLSEVRSDLIVVKLGKEGFADLSVSFDSCIVTMSALISLTRLFSSVFLFLIPLMLIWIIFRFFVEMTLGLA